MRRAEDAIHTRSGFQGGPRYRQTRIAASVFVTTDQDYWPLCIDDGDPIGPRAETPLGRCDATISGDVARSTAPPSLFCLWNDEISSEQKTDQMRRCAYPSVLYV